MKSSCLYKNQRMNLCPDVDGEKVFGVWGYCSSNHNLFRAQIRLLSIHKNCFLRKFCNFHFSAPALCLQIETYNFQLHTLKLQLFSKNCAKFYPSTLKRPNAKKLITLPTSVLCAQAKLRFLMTRLILPLSTWIHGPGAWR